MSHLFFKTPWMLAMTPLVMVMPLQAANYSESANGELSSVGASPTVISVSPGANVVSGKMGRGAETPGATDADIWTFTIPEGQQLTAIDFTQLTGSASLVSGSFFAVSAGKSIDKSTAAAHLSNMLVASTGDVLATLASTKLFSSGFGSSPGVSGVTSPLGAGDYTFWFQEAGAASVDYAIRFDIQAVPEPSTFALIGLSLGGAMWMRRRANRTQIPSR